MIYIYPGRYDYNTAKLLFFFFKPVAFTQSFPGNTTKYIVGTITLRDIII